MSAERNVLAQQLLENYEIEPPNDGQIDVEVHVYIRNFEYNSSADRKHRMQLLLRLKWVDSRLQHQSHLETVNFPADGIWVPDIYFENEIQVTEQRTLQGSNTARVNRNGEVYFQRRLNVELSCPMDLHNYPLDIQRCPLIISSWSLPETRLRLKWSSVPIMLNKHVLEMGDFRLKSFETQNCSSSTSADIISCIHIDFVMERMVLPYLVRVFIPLSMCVLISCLSFWIFCSPVRITLLMVDLMGATFLAHFITVNSPVTDYTKYIDVFTGTSLAFIVFALIEFVTVQFVYKRELMSEKVHSMMNDIRINWIDYLCRFFVPLLFLVFVIVYFALALFSRA